MRTQWSVLALLAVVLSAGCQTSPLAGGDPYTWSASGNRALLASDAAPEAGAPKPRTRERPLQVSVGDAVAEAMQVNPGVQQARLSAAIALTVEHEARAGLRPSIYFSGSFRHRDEAPATNAPELGVSFTVGPRDVWGFEVGMNFPIFAFGKYAYGHKSAKYARRAAEADSRAAEADTAAAVTAAALDLLLTIRAVSVAESNVSALAQQVKDAQSLLDAGRVTKSALLEAQVQLDRAQRQQERAQSLIRIRRMVLNRLLGRPVDMQTEVAEPPKTSEPEYEFDRLVEEAYGARPELHASRLRVEAAVRAVKSAVGAALPELRGNVSFSNDNSPFGSPSDFAIFALTLDFPLYSGGAKSARIRRSQRELEMARIALQDLERQIVNEVAGAHREVVQTFLDIAVADRSIRRSEENLRIQREKFSSGRATSQEVLESTSLLTQSRFDYISSVYSHHAAVAELNRVRGIHPRDWSDVNQAALPKPEPESEPKADAEAEAETEAEAEAEKEKE